MMKTTSKIQEIKTRLSIDEAVNHYLPGVQLQKKGSRLWALCPFHREKTPSFCIYPATNSFFCFSCHTGGDQIDLVSRATGLPLKDTVRLLAGDLGLAEPTPAKRRKIAVNIEKRRKEKEMEEKLEQLVNNAYHRLVNIERWIFLILKHVYTTRDLDRPAVIWALYKKDHIKFLLDTLIDGTPADKLRAAVVAEEVGLLK